MSKKLLNYGALASLGCAATFVFGMVLLVTQLMPYIDLQDHPEQAVNYVLEHHGLLSLWNFVIYVLFGVLLATLVIVLNQQLSPVQSLLSQLSSVMGLIWICLVMASGLLANVGLTRVIELAHVQPEMARSLWLSVITIKHGLGGSNEIVGGLWVLLVSIALWRNRFYTKILFIIGVAAGVAGVVSALPSLSDLGALFGLLLIVWFIYLSWVMMRESASTAYSDGGGPL